MTEKQDRKEESPAGSDLEDLLKAHIRVVAAQRNASALSASLREAQQQVEARQREFLQVRATVESKTGLRYNEETLALEPKGK